MENALSSEFSLLLKGKCFIDKRSKQFCFRATTFSINCLKEKPVYKATRDFPLGQL